MQELPGNPLDNQRKFFTQLNDILYFVIFHPWIAGLFVFFSRGDLPFNSGLARVHLRSSVRRVK